MKKLKVLAGMVLLNAFVASSAYAQVVGSDAGEDIGLIRIIKSLIGQMQAGGIFLQVAAFLVGLFFAWMFWGCLTKMSDEQARKQENLVPKSIAYLIGGAGLMFLSVMPVIMGETVFGVDGGPEVSEAVDTEKFGFKN